MRVSKPKRFPRYRIFTVDNSGEVPRRSNFYCDTYAGALDYATLFFRSVSHGLYKIYDRAFVDNPDVKRSLHEERYW